MPNPKTKTKTSLAELLAQQPARNDWSNGRPGAASNGRRNGDDDGFPKYDPKAYESEEEEEEEDENAGPSAGGSFAVLAGLNGGADDADADNWVTVGSKQKKRGLAPVPAPATAAAASSAPAARRPATAPAPLPRLAPPAPAAPLPRPLGIPGGGSAAGPSRAPYNVAQAFTAAVASAPRTPRPQTHDSEGRPLTDTYYRQFQKVYKNSSGDVCMRFHKTDVVMVRPNGDVFLTSGGFKTRTTFCTIAEGLDALDFSLTSSLGGEGKGEWSVVAPDGTRHPFQDEMTIAATSEADRVRGARLLGTYRAGTGAAVPSPPPTGLAGAAAAAPRAPAPAPAPLPAPTPGSTWSYRSAAGVAPAAAPLAAAGLSTSTAPAAVGAYTPHLRPAPGPGAPFGFSPAPASTAAPAPTPVPTVRTAESLSKLQDALDAALAIQRDEAAAGTAGAAAGLADADLEDEHACVACMSRPKTTLFLPCGHLVLCLPCAEMELGRTGACCICREHVEQHVEMGG